MSSCWIIRVQSAMSSARMTNSCLSTSVSSSKRASLVEVEPGLMVKILFFSAMGSLLMGAASRTRPDPERCIFRR